MADLTKVIDPEIFTFNSAVAGTVSVGATEVNHNVALPSGITGNFFLSFITRTGDVAHAYVPPNAATDTKLGDSSSDSTKLKFISDTGFDIESTAGSPIELGDGTKIRANVDQVIIRQFLEWVLGNIASGGQGFIIGDETDSTATIYHKTTSTTVGFIRKNVASGKVQLSNDGSAWFDADNAGVGVVNWSDGLNSTNGNADPYVDVDGTEPFLTGGTNAESNPVTWAAVTDGSFRISIDGTAYNVDGVNFSADVTMDDVAATIQTALRAATGGNETVAWDTDKFVITSTTTRATSAVSVTETSTGTVGTDISGAGASDFMDCDTGNGTPTAVALIGGLEINNSKLRAKVKTGGGVARDADGLSVDQSADFNFTGNITKDGQEFVISSSAKFTSTGTATLETGISGNVIRTLTADASGLSAGAVSVLADGITVATASAGESKTGIGEASSEVTATAIDTPFDIANAGLTTSFDPSQMTNIYSVRFSVDGSKMYLLSDANTIYQYSLSTAFTVSTASYDSKSFSVAGQETGAVSFAFNREGTKMYAIGNVQLSVFQYTLSTPWDISTASYDSVSFSFSGQITTARTIFFDKSGTRMYIASNANAQGIRQYSLSTPFDISTASYVDVGFTGSDGVFGIWISDDGTRFFSIRNRTTDGVVRQDLSTPWDISTIGSTVVTFDTGAQESNSQTLAFSDAGDKMYVAGSGSDRVYQYRAGAAYSGTSFASKL